MINCCFLYVFFFFFSSRRRHTRFSRDWSSDVCSSDLFANLDADLDEDAGSIGQKVRRALGEPEARAQPTEEQAKLSRDFLFLAGGLSTVYIVFHSLVGGAVLRRYLLPVFPVFYLGAVTLAWKLP